MIISILCPTKHCRKCKRMILFVEKTVEEIGINAEIEFLSKTDKMQKNETWIVSSLFVYKEVVSRCYIPAKEYLIVKINKFLYFNSNGRQ